MAQSFWLFGSHLTILADEEKTNAHYDLIEGVLPSGATTPLHVHANYSETIIVTEGQLTIHLQGESIRMKAGDQYFIPAGKPHAVVSSGKTFARAMTIASPSGFAKLIRRVGVQGRINEVPLSGNSMERFMSVSNEIGDLILGPPGTRP